MVYAKQMKDGEIIALDIYYFQPQFGEDSAMEIITKEEYDELKEAITPPPTETDEISDSEALAIITGEVSGDDA